MPLIYRTNRAWVSAAALAVFATLPNPAYAQQQRPANAQATSINLEDLPYPYPVRVLEQARHQAGSDRSAANGRGLRKSER
jgi:hypothetical protein